MKQGYDVFGKAYGIMLRNDLHAIGSIDCELLQNMVLLDEETYDYFYKNTVPVIDMREHELYDFAQQFRGFNEHQTIENILRYTATRASEFHVPFEEMKFGGTEKEILGRGTDWCADMARVGVVLLGCLGISSRVLYLANEDRAYNGHVVTEAFYEGKYGVCDFLYGYCFYDKKPLDAYELTKNFQYLQKYSDSYSALYKSVAISEYNPMEKHNYQISIPNAYYMNLINSNHNNKWIMGEDL